MGRDAELECPRCRLAAAKPDSRQAHCSRCGAELVSAHSPTEAWVRAYLYDRDPTRVSSPPVVELR